MLRARSHGLLIATPEYAHGLPGSLKNLLDWLVGSGELYGKRVVIVSAVPTAVRGSECKDQMIRDAMKEVLAAFVAAP